MKKDSSAKKILVAYGLLIFYGWFTAGVFYEMRHRPGWAQFLTLAVWAAVAWPFFDGVFHIGEEDANDSPL